MSREHLIVVSMIKYIVALVGLMLTFWFLVTGLYRNDKARFVKAVLVFISAAAILILFSVIEFYLLSN